MVRHDINRILVEATVSKTIKSIESDPERSIRNLVDLGRNFAKGRFNKHFLNLAQTMLQNEDSAYYALIKDLVNNVDHDTLKTFGVNLGYNGCTSGAKLIRSNEAKLGYNIPWAISIHFDGAEGHLSPADLERIIAQGCELGVFVYFLFIHSLSLDPELCQLLEQYDDCAFVLLGEPELFDEVTISRLGSFHNLMLSVSAKTDAVFHVTEEMRARRILYSIHQSIAEDEVEEVLSGAFLERAGETQCFFAALLCYDFYETDAHAKIQQYVDSVRRSQRYPLILMDPATDLSTIDCVISDDACSASFDCEGHLVLASSELSVMEETDIRRDSLREILARCCSKTK